jgi:DNA-binding response OmpR family regulator
MNRRALIVEQEPAALAAVRMRFSADGWEIDAAANCDSALALLEQRRYSIIIADGPCHGPGGAQAFARLVRETQPGAILLLATPDPTHRAQAGESMLEIQMLLAQPVALERLAELAVRLGGERTLSA